MRDIVERLIAVIALLVLSPLLIVVAFAIWFEDGSPILFRQKRIGLAGKPFETIKLRSMRRTIKGPVITCGGDARVTRVGKLIRRYKIDELPQLWNVLRGEMLLIGPRPEIPEFVDQKDPLWRDVLGVKPGITNATTIVFRDEESMLAGQPSPESYYREQLLPIKLKLHIAHIKQQSLRRDIMLVLFTVYYSAFPARFNANTLKRKLFADATI